MTTTNLPNRVEETDSGEEVKSFFNKFFEEPLTFPASQIDAVVGFLLKRGFSELSAKSTGIVLLSQAKLEGINVFKLLDTLKTIDTKQLNGIVTQVMNSSREKTSLLGYKIVNIEETIESRNIRP